AAIDFFTVPTATFRVQFVFVVLSHERRRVLHFGVTEHPTQEWTMQQMRESFPGDEAPRYVLRDRDAIYGRDFADMTRDIGMEEVLTATGIGRMDCYPNKDAVDEGSRYCWRGSRDF